MQDSRDAVLQNIDLLPEILLRLQVKDVLRCECVSKKWLAIISNPRFSYSHTLRMCKTSSPISLLLRRYKHKLEFQIVPLTNSNANPSPIRTFEFYILQSCNGFLLIKASHFIPGIHMPLLCFQHYYSIFNPATSNFVMLEFPSRIFKLEISALYFAYDPLRSPHFKVISFRKILIDRRWSVTNDHASNTNRFKVNVFSSETGSWSDDGVFFIASLSTSVESGIYCNGSIHWFSTLGAGDSVYFDVHQQCFNTLPNPTTVDYDNLVVKYFGESRGHLHLILSNTNECLTSDILELKKDYSDWIVRYHVDLNLANPNFSVLCVVRQANEEDSMLVLFLDSKILSYNLKDHTSRIIYEVDEVGESFQYFETLLNI